MAGPVEGPPSTPVVLKRVPAWGAETAAPEENSPDDAVGAPPVLPPEPVLLPELVEPAVDPLVEPVAPVVPVLAEPVEDEVAVAEVAEAVAPVVDPDGVLPPVDFAQPADEIIAANASRVWRDRLEAGMGCSQKLNTQLNQLDIANFGEREDTGVAQAVSILRGYARLVRSPDPGRGAIKLSLGGRAAPSPHATVSGLLRRRVPLGVGLAVSRQTEQRLEKSVKLPGGMKLLGGGHLRVTGVPLKVMRPGRDCG